MAFYSKQKRLTDIYHDTVKQCTRGPFATFQPGPSTRYHVSLIQERSANAVQKPVSEPQDETSDADIIIKDMDTLTMARHLWNDYNTGDDGYTAKILVLNMASEYRPGGGVEHGSMAQEEELFRRTDYFKGTTKELYPLNHELVVTENISILKDVDYELFEDDDIITVDMVACPAIRRPKLDKTKTMYASKHDRKIMRDRIFSIFQLAVGLEYDVLVLGALGCGAFCNPAAEVQAIFQEAVDMYRHKFFTIGFAVLDNGTGNYATFSKIH